jgi:hypothetical protein
LCRRSDSAEAKSLDSPGKVPSVFRDRLVLGTVVRVCTPAETRVAEPFDEVLSGVCGLCKPESRSDERVFKQDLNVLQIQTASDFAEQNGKCFREGRGNRLSEAQQAEGKAVVGCVIRAQASLNEGRLSFRVG